MELIPSQALALGVDRLSPKLFKGSPRLLRLVGIFFNRFHQKADARVRCKAWLLVGFEYAVFKGCCDYLDHECTYAVEGFCSL